MAKTKAIDTETLPSEPQKTSVIVARLQVAGLILLLLALMSISVATTLMATGVVNIYPDAGKAPQSLTDAKLICDEALVSEHGEKLQTYILDDLSSHADNQRGGYKLYYELTMFREDNKHSGTNRFYVNCFLSASGRIRQLDLYEEKSFVPKAGRRTKGNAFGL